MQGGAIFMIQSKRKPVRRTAIHKPQRQYLAAILRAFLFGIGADLLLFAGCAAVFSTLPIPNRLVQPTACVILGIGTAVSGAALAAGIGRQRLLCGLACGAFYTICIATASALTGGVVLNEAAIALICVLVFSGMFGSVLTVLRPARSLR